ncbi:hypothetical protein [Burkholderia ubonensis]|uniref:hypothetical protein n=1 Tax=Burkholderia ubonensis TaxID=101571 RepID=UPI000AE6FE85|nr:hypothetical protein [Burkholderia ubonensis]
MRKSIIVIGTLISMSVANAFGESIPEIRLTIAPEAAEFIRTLPDTKRTAIKRDIARSHQFMTYRLGAKTWFDISEPLSVSEWNKNVKPMLAVSPDRWLSRWSFDFATSGKDSDGNSLWTPLVHTDENLYLPAYACDSVVVSKVTISGDDIIINLDSTLIGTYGYKYSPPEKEKLVTVLRFNSRGLITDVSQSEPIVPLNYKTQYQATPYTRSAEGMKAHTSRCN